MHFSHLIQINDSRHAAIQPLSREQLWRGLVLRAERPSHFLLGLDACEIVSRGANTLMRELRFGRIVVRDRVTFAPPVEVRYDVEASREVPGGCLIMRIEEPQSGALFVRFEYQLHVEAGNVADYLNEFRKSAYVESDIDTIRMIRQLAASELLSENGYAM